MAVGWGCHGSSEKLTQATASGLQRGGVASCLWAAAASRLYLEGGLGPQLGEEMDTEAGSTGNLFLPVCEDLQ